MTNNNNFKIIVEDSIYSTWEIFNAEDYSKCDSIIINPFSLKLFSNDVFSFENNSNNIIIVHSIIRCGTSIPGVLILADNKTYGKIGNKSLYKCIPDDTRLPYFLIPYNLKNVKFSKAFQNKYVTFSYLNWNYKHPHGTLCNTIGDINILDNFYEYQLFCKSLNSSIQKFKRDATCAIKNKPHDDIINTIMKKYDSIEDRTDPQWFIFSIDPTQCSDFDDAFSIKQLDNNTLQISIYITNVTIWMDILNLWESFSRRISTIYLPDKKRPMLPTILSDCLCSLQKNVSRIAFVMDLFISDGIIVKTHFSNVLIKVANNYVYEETELINNKHYIFLLKQSKLLCKTYKYINNIRNSHDLVSYLMILMNSQCALQMKKYKCGIFRSTLMKSIDELPEHLPDDISKYITIWKSATGIYIDAKNVDNISNTMRHNLLHLDSYIHITSPIRRIVDLLNIISLQQNMNIIKLSTSAYNFYDNWLQQLDYINATMRSIRKMQCDCSLLDLCSDINILNNTYNGYIFDKIKRNDGLFQYIVYLPKLKLTSKITMRNDFNDYSMKQFKLYLFNDEIRFKKKIRLHCVDL
jgi:hypothetical protein